MSSFGAVELCMCGCLGWGLASSLAMVSYILSRAIRKGGRE